MATGTPVNTNQIPEGFQNITVRTWDVTRFHETKGLSRAQITELSKASQNERGPGPFVWIHVPFNSMSLCEVSEEFLGQ